jgi:DNA-binding beta-propeller fold protein YncE
MTRLTRNRTSRARRRHGAGFRSRPRLEGLEDRCLLTPTITEFPTPTASSGPSGITTGPDGNLWFAEQAVGKIAEINPTTHTITEFVVPSGSGSSPNGITAGPDGNLWFTEGVAGKIAMINPDTHAITEYAAADAGGISAGPDGNLWFAEPDNGKIGMFNPASHVVTEYPIPYASSRPIGITNGPDGNVWFADRGNGSIGVVTLNQTPSALAGLSLNKVGSGYALQVSSKGPTAATSGGLAVATTTRTPDPLLVPLVLDSPDLWDGLRFKKRSRSI